MEHAYIPSRKFIKMSFQVVKLALFYNFGTSLYIKNINMFI